MGDLSRHLSAHEFACKCSRPACSGKDRQVDRLLIAGIEWIIERILKADATLSHAGVRVLINSGLRCPPHDLWAREHDARERGVPVPAGNGQHVNGIAADCVFQWAMNGTWGAPRQLYILSLAESIPIWEYGRGGIGLYSNRIHLDTRGGKGARW